MTGVMASPSCISSDMLGFITLHYTPDIDAWAGTDFETLPLVGMSMAIA